MFYFPAKYISTFHVFHVSQVEIKLSDNNSEYIVMDLVEDLGDGVLLPELTKALTLKDIWYREDPKLTFHR